MDSNANYVRVKEWLHTLTIVRGQLLTLLSKLEYESGLDIERVVDGIKLFCDDDGCMIRSNFIGYQDRQQLDFPLNAAGDHFRIGQKWYPFDDQAKLILMSRIVISAMRSVSREVLIAARQKHLDSQASKVRADIKETVKKPGIARDAIERLFESEFAKRKKP